MHNSERILFREYGIQLHLGKDDALFMNVLCGHVGQFGIEFILNDVESAQYRDRGDEFIRELSRVVQKDWKIYAARGRTC